MSSGLAASGARALPTAPRSLGNTSPTTGLEAALDPWWGGAGLPPSWAQQARAQRGPSLRSSTSHSGRLALALAPWLLSWPWKSFQALLLTLTLGSPAPSLQIRSPCVPWGCFPEVVPQQMSGGPKSLEWGDMCGEMQRSTCSDYPRAVLPIHQAPHIPEAGSPRSCV